MKLARYFNRFQLVSALNQQGLLPFGVKSASAIRRGYMVGFNTGVAAEITTIQAVQIAGVAADDNTAAEASADSVMTVHCIPIGHGHRFAVPVEQNALITIAAVGTIVDLQSANTIDISDAITLGWGFRIDAIDVSAEAIAANAFGFAIGHFEYVAAS